MTKQNIKITNLYIYPVKSLKGISINESILTPKGLKYDRNWMIVDQDNNFVTQRQIPEMSLISISINFKQLVFEKENFSKITINLDSDKNNLIKTEVWGNNCEGFDEGIEISEWLTNAIGKQYGKSLKLIRFSDKFIRNVDPKYLKEEKSNTAFADGFPFLVTSQESLNLLNKSLIAKGETPVPMDRFRPNIVIKNLKPFEEYKLETLMETENNFSLGLRKPCKRCKIVTINQENSEIINPAEPLLTLSEINSLSDKKGAYFGQNSTLLSGENKTIKVGDLLFSPSKK